MNKDNINELITYHKQMDSLKKKLEKCKDILKEEMLAEGLNDIVENGTKITLTHGTKTTPAKDAVTQLILKGLTQCVTQTPEVNVERLRLEIGVSITQDDFNKIVKETPTVTMRIK